MSIENTEPTGTETSPQQPLSYSGPIVARYGRYFRNARYILTAILIGVGIWSIRDGFYKFPKETSDAIARGQPDPHGKWDAPLNKVLGIVLPPLGIYVLVSMLYRSRGEIRLESETLHVPGHPPIPLSSIRRIDKSKWERRGMAYIDYEIEQPPAKGRVLLDDFVYEQKPIDDIVKRIEEYAAAVAGEPAAEAEGA
jgi:hypothetical protein